MLRAADLEMAVAGTAVGTVEAALTGNASGDGNLSQTLDGID